MKSKKSSEKKVMVFFAVTATSVYRIGPSKDGGVEVKKVAVHPGASSSFPVGHVLKPWGALQMVSVGRQIITFIPEGGGITSINRHIEGVNTRWWGGNTSPVVALFLTRKQAMTCSKEDKLVFCDPRWEKETIKVLQRIGADDPFYSICEWGDMLLMPSEKWKKVGGE